ncbi:AlpA family transcriptional regulator [Halomonas sp. TBZ9]|uniref:AlpA family transcriptional regulator n=1 Tax=Vreelandella azerica TaxID=2732867 RepID=A0A7Y3XBM2_9GAMM|nr:AlpA family transcriptional regulator [Halomonas azerica]NOG32473.1 AlpA family transcriptional regulator [Halomonas azerica]
MTDTNETQYQQLLRRNTVLERCGMSTSTLYRLMDQQQFPQPVRIGGRAVAWVESEINEWIEKRIEERNSAA